jgi:hypothetical protein
MLLPQLTTDLGQPSDIVVCGDQVFVAHDESVYTFRISSGEHIRTWQPRFPRALVALAASSSKIFVASKSHLHAFHITDGRRSLDHMRWPRSVECVRLATASNRLCALDRGTKSVHVFHSDDGAWLFEFPVCLLPWSDTPHLFATEDEVYISSSRSVCIGSVLHVHSTNDGTFLRKFNVRPPVTGFMIGCLSDTTGKFLTVEPPICHRFHPDGSRDRETKLLSLTRPRCIAFDRVREQVVVFEEVANQRRLTWV